MEKESRHFDVQQGAGQGVREEKSAAGGGVTKELPVAKRIANEIILQARKRPGNTDLVSKIYGLRMEIARELIEFMDKYREAEREGNLKRLREKVEN